MEPDVATGISDCQRGFLRGRSMFANLMGVEEVVLRHSIKHGSSAMVVFDFEAAFPSVSQEFLDAIAAQGWPSWRAHFA